MFQGPNIALQLMLYIYAHNHDAHAMFSKTMQCNTEGVTEAKDHIEQYSQIFGCEIGLFPFRYLGIPMNHKKTQ